MTKNNQMLFTLLKRLDKLEKIYKRYETTKSMSGNPDMIEACNNEMNSIRSQIADINSKIKKLNET
jgi:hypothetical protein